MSYGPTDLSKNLSDYFDFVTTFAYSPKRALAFASAKGKLDHQLVLYALLALLLSLCLDQALTFVGIERPKLYLLGKQAARVANEYRDNPLLWPGLVLLSTALIAVPVHILGKSIGWVDKRIKLGDVPLAFDGKLSDSLNAAFGFLAFFVPFSVFFLYVGTTLELRFFDHQYNFAAEFWLFIPLLPWYLAAAFAGCHPNSTWQVGLIHVVIAIGLLLAGYEALTTRT